MFWKKRKDPTPLEELDTKGEFERLTDELIQETISSDGEMMQQLNRMLDGYSADQNPLSVQDAKNILFSVLLVAVRQRRRLSGRIATSVEKGALFSQYYGKIREINHYTVRANAKLERMELARRQYVYQQQIYWSVVGRTYNETGYSSDELEKVKGVIDDVMPPQVDTWERLDKEGGGGGEDESEEE